MKPGQRVVVVNGPPFWMGRTGTVFGGLIITKYEWAVCMDGSDTEVVSYLTDELQSI